MGGTKLQLGVLQNYPKTCPITPYGDIPVKLVLGFPHVGKTDIAQARDKSYLQLTIVLKSVQV
jgi:hypothetical protein